MVSNVITYSAVFSALEKGRYPEQALQVFKTMHWRSVVPDLINCNALISALKTGK